MIPVSRKNNYPNKKTDSRLGLNTLTTEITFTPEYPQINDDTFYIWYSNDISVKVGPLEFFTQHFILKAKSKNKVYKIEAIDIIIKH